jgi:hypothetical protein
MHTMRTLRPTQNPRSLLSLPVLCLLLALGASLAVAAGPLDGKTFVSEDDELVFDDGTFRSVECDEWGFTAAPYTTTADGDAIKFTAVATSPNDGTMEWSGTVRGDEIEAHYHWEKKGWFRTKTKDKDLSGALKK